MRFYFVLRFQAFIFHLEGHPNITGYQQCVTYHYFEEEIYQIIYNVLVMCLMYTFPLIVILYCYGSIYYEIFSRTNPRNLGKRELLPYRLSNHAQYFYLMPCFAESFRRSSIDVLGRAKRKTLRMTIMIVIVFVVCWTPYYVMSLWYVIESSMRSSFQCLEHAVPSLLILQVLARQGVSQKRGPTNTEGTVSVRQHEQLHEPGGVRCL